MIGMIASDIITCLPTATSTETCFAVPAETDTIKRQASVRDWDETKVKRKAAFIGWLEHCRLLLWWMPTLIIFSPTTVMPYPPTESSIPSPASKELERLTGKCQDSYERLMKACEVGSCRPCSHYFKRACSAIITPKVNVSSPREIREWQPEGSGDILTG